MCHCSRWASTDSGNDRAIMGEYFRPWRRRCGLVTLAFACLLMVVYINSLWTTNAISVSCPGPDVIEGVASIDRHFVLMKSAPANHECGVLPQFPIDFPSYSRLKGNWVFGPQGFENPAIQWSWRFGHFGLGELHLINGNANWRVRFLTFSSWPIVMPLIVLSAYQLFGRLRSQPSPAHNLERRRDG